MDRSVEKECSWCIGKTEGRRAAEGNKGSMLIPRLRQDASVSAAAFAAWYRERDGNSSLLSRPGVYQIDVVPKLLSRK